MQLFAACQPEHRVLATLDLDCGGVHGYLELVAALSDPAHPEHEEYLEWAGGPIDPGAFAASAVRFDDPAKRWRIAFEDGAD